MKIVLAVDILTERAESYVDESVTVNTNTKLPTCSEEKKRGRSSDLCLMLNLMTILVGADGRLSHNGGLISHHYYV